MPLLPHQTQINDRIVQDLLFGETPESKPDAEPATIGGMPVSLILPGADQSPRLSARCIRFTRHDYVLAMNTRSLDALHDRYQTISVLSPLCEKALRPVFEQWNHDWFVRATIKECADDTDSVDLNTCIFIHSLFEG